MFKLIGTLAVAAALAIGSATAAQAHQPVPSQAAPATQVSQSAGQIAQPAGTATASASSSGGGSFMDNLKSIVRAIFGGGDDGPTEGGEGTDPDQDSDDDQASDTDTDSDVDKD